MFGRRPPVDAVLSKSGKVGEDSKKRRRSWEEDDSDESSNDAEITEADLERWREEEQIQEEREERARLERLRSEARVLERVNDAFQALPRRDTREQRPLASAVLEVERALEERRQQKEDPQLPTELPASITGVGTVSAAAAAAAAAAASIQRDWERRAEQPRQENNGATLSALLRLSA
eukprot:TRINITY_DN14227_c0_g1_i1.p1 TRINITY_DN14227_c0_g1~~TRINITY_DN14227_c0_g1_i1.p1  ORF type:complete len:178 (+),score=52.10 TRINITY_DN14227_c0_g1_i1:91-624(+)